MDEKRWFVVVFGYSALSFIALFILASNYHYTVDDGQGGFDWVERDFGVVPVLIIPGALAFIVIALVGIVRLVAWFFTSRE
jgi:hypothetical protein